MTSRKRLGAWIVGLGAVAAGCASKSTATTTAEDAGVNDVGKACAIRAAWTRATHSECSSCTTYAIDVPCTCNPIAGSCRDLAQAKAAEADCTQEVGDCVQNCASDCACVVACYAGHDRCRAAAGAVDGCVANVCDSTCR